MTQAMGIIMALYSIQRGIVSSLPHLHAHGTFHRGFPLKIHYGLYTQGMLGLTRPKRLLVREEILV
jgi:hypothetical protein